MTEETKSNENLKLQKIVDELSTLTVMEAADLAKKLEDAWGVSAQAAMATATAPAESAEEKTDYSVILKSYPDNKKIPAIKIIRAECDLGLKEAKDFVEAAPKEVKGGLTKQEADELKKKIVEACEGAEVEIK
tara:strand:+ start:35 stop:433 length:399 start_codon:yes stop_codon:yes gene_type:complete